MIPADRKMPSEDNRNGANERTALDRVVVEHLTVRSRRSVAEVITDISLSVPAGEILGVVGESGSGKTTLGLAMLNHARRGLEISGGSVCLDGQILGDLSAGEFRAMRGRALAYVPQDPGTALNPARRIGPQIAEALTTHGHGKAEAAERISQLLGEVGLGDRPDVLRAYPHQLSGGQQQRVAIAMAFACLPGLIVMDEPTTGLDVTTQRTVLDTVRELCGRYGVSAIYVSHDVLVVGTLANRVAVVYSGRVVELGPTDEVFRNPQHPYTRGLLASVPSPERATHVVGMEGVQPRPGQRPRGCAFAPRCPVSFDRCLSERPELVAAGSADHLARCFLVEEGRSSVLPVTEVTSAVVSQSPPRTERRSGTLVVAGLDATYGQKQVLFDVSLDLPAQTCLGIVGESGSGKTTLARCVAGLHTSWTGRIAFDEIDLTPGVRGRSKETLRKMQYIFQNPYGSLNPRRTIGSLISQPLEHFTTLGRRERDQRVMAAMEMVALSTKMVNRYPDQVSGGERQRVAIARALAVEPRVLICDEVTSALDVSVQATVIEMLVQLQAEQGLSMLFITHNLAVVRSITQHVVVMQLGRVVETGPTDDLLDAPQTAYTQRLCADIPKFADIGGA
jgi:peptide/nickel transport system ATP-binding protein